jgi:hypothetical protein
VALGFSGSEYVGLMPVVLLDNIVLEWSRHGVPAVNDVLAHYMSSIGGRFELNAAKTAYRRHRYDGGCRCSMVFRNRNTTGCIFSVDDASNERLVNKCTRFGTSPAKTRRLTHTSVGYTLGYGG